MLADKNRLPFFWKLMKMNKTFLHYQFMCKERKFWRKAPARTSISTLKGLSILPVFSKQTNVSREFWELHSMTGTVETVFASSIARCDAFWAIYFTLKLFLCLLLQWYEYFLEKKALKFLFSWANFKKT